MHSLTLARLLEWGEDISKIRRFFPEYLRVAMPMELIRYKEKGDELKGPII